MGSLILQVTRSLGSDSPMSGFETPPLLVDNSNNRVTDRRRSASLLARCAKHQDEGHVLTGARRAVTAQHSVPRQRRCRRGGCASHAGSWIAWWVVVSASRLGEERRDGGRRRGD
eukprot:scaffold215201_cov36-Tisochrysis_lutea.AAC.2